MTDEYFMMQALKEAKKARFNKLKQWSNLTITK